MRRQLHRNLVLSEVVWTDQTPGSEDSNAKILEVTVKGFVIFGSVWRNDPEDPEFNIAKFLSVLIFDMFESLSW